MKHQYAAEQFRNFQFFLGVVEDRDDPMRLGRCRVRCHGIHSEDKSEIPTEALPWAMPIMPYNSASLSGIGQSPTGIIEGSWVFGFFIDGRDMQQPMVLGTLIGAPDQLPDPTMGFNDPNGVYPRVEIPEETDVNRLARGTDINASTLKSARAGENNLAHKIANRVTDVKVAMPPGGEGEPGAKDGVPSSVKDGSPPGSYPAIYFSRPSWNEPNPRYGGQEVGTKGELNIHDVRKGTAVPNYGNESRYPLNHTWTTESGHVHETDDSPKAERIHQYHTAGTFTEIQPNGTRVTKIVGDDFEMVLHDKNVAVWGNVNITVHDSDLRLYVTKDAEKDKGGDLYIETDGDFNINVKGDMTTKIQGTEYKEVKTDSATNIEGKQSLRVNKDQIIKVNQNRRTNIRHNDEKVVGRIEDTIVQQTAQKKVKDSITVSTGNNITTSAGNNIIQKAVSNVNIETLANYNLDATLKVDVDAGSDIEFDTTNNFEVGVTRTPIQTTIKGTKIDLNP